MTAWIAALLAAFIYAGATDRPWLIGVTVCLGIVTAVVGLANLDTPLEEQD